MAGEVLVFVGHKIPINPIVNIAKNFDINKKVIIVDADIDMATLGLVLGMPQSPITLQDVLKGEANPEDALYPGPGGIKFMPAAIATGKLKTIDPEKFSLTILIISYHSFLLTVFITHCTVSLSKPNLTISSS